MALRAQHTTTHANRHLISHLHRFWQHTCSKNSLYKHIENTLKVYYFFDSESQQTFNKNWAQTGSITFSVFPGNTDVVLCIFVACSCVLFFVSNRALSSPGHRSKVTVHHKFVFRNVLCKMLFYYIAINPTERCFTKNEKKKIHFILIGLV